MKHILCFGDSNTWGLIPGTTKKKYPWGVRWTSILQEKLNPYHIRVIEDGLCGRTTVYEDSMRDFRRGSHVLPLSLERHSEIDTMVLMLGTNDCKTCYQASAREIGNGIEQLLEQVKAFNPLMNIILVSPIELGTEVWRPEFDPEFDQESIEKSKNLKDVYQRIADKWNIEFLAASDFAKPSKEDMEHLNQDGHKDLADVIFNKIEAIYEMAS